MAAPVIQGTRSSVTISGTTHVHNHTSASVVGEALLMHMRWYSTATLNSITIPGETVELIGTTATGGPSNGRSRWAIVKNIASAGVKEITVSMSGTTGGGGLEVWRISGQDTVNTVNVQNQSTGTSAAPTVALTTTVNECLGFAVIQNNGDGDATAVSSPFTLFSTALVDQAWYDEGASSADMGTAGTVNVQFTLPSSSTFLLNAIAIAPASSTVGFNVVQTGQVAVTTTSAVTGDIGFVQPTLAWRIPTDAPNSTAVKVMIYSGSSGSQSIVTQAATTVSGGVIEISGTGTIGAKAFAIVHNYDDDTNTTSIFGGPAIATLVSV